MATKKQKGDRPEAPQEPFEFYKEMLALLERGAAGDVETVKARMRARIKLAEERKSRRQRNSRVISGYRAQMP